MRSRPVLKGIVLSALMILISLVPAVNGDGCYIPVNPADVFESGQNAIIGWDGEVERMYLSVNIYANRDTTGFHIVPFPSMPEISLGSLSIFQNHTEQLRGFRKEYHDHDGMSLGDGSSNSEKEPSVEILYQESIGEHDVTVIRVNDVTGFKEELMEIVDEIGIDMDKWPDGLNRIITNYTADGYNYFTVDNYPIYKKEKTVDPLVYEFETDELFFPLEISSILKGESLVRLALFTDPDMAIDTSVLYDLPGGYYGDGNFVDHTRILKIDKDLHSMFPKGANHRYVTFELPLSRVRGDIVIPREEWVTWSDRSEEDDLYNGNYEATSISELGIILYTGNDHHQGISISCMDVMDRSIRWIWEPPALKGYEIYDIRTFVVDVDLDGDIDILVDVRERDGSKLYSLDPQTGDEIEIRQSQFDFFPEKIQIFRDKAGKEYVGIMSTYKMIVIDPETWLCIAVLESPEEDLGHNGRSKIPMDRYAMHRWNDFGDGITFHDGYHHYAWSPFYELPDGRGPSGNITEKNIWVQDFRFTVEIVHNDTKYYFGERWTNEPATYLYTFDPDTGDLLEQVSYEDYPELRSIRNSIVLDFDENGEDELILKHGGNDGTSFVSCLNPISGKRYWKNDLGEKFWFFEKMDPIDLDNDGHLELMLKLKDKVAVLSLLDGTLIWSESECQIIEGNPDLDGDGGKEIITSHSYNNIRITDPMNNTETLNISCSLEDWRGPPVFICRDFNWDGHQDVLYMTNEWGVYGPHNLVLIDGKTGDESRFMNLYQDWWIIDFFEGEDTGMLIIQGRYNKIGIRIDGEMMEELQGSEMVEHSITILEAGPEEEEEPHLLEDEDRMTNIYVIILIWLVIFVITIAVYIPIIKHKNRQR